MSDEGNTKPSAEGSGSAAPDAVGEMKKMIETLTGSISNMKAEFNRKLDSVASRPFVPPAPEVKKKPLTELIYEAPDEAIREIASTVESEVETRLTEKLAKVEENRAMSTKLTSDFPELNDPSNPLTVKANEYFTALDPKERKDPRALRAAVLEAALELNIAPKPKRKKVVEESEDSFSLSSQGAPAPKKSSRKGEVADETLQAAALMGLNVNDPKVVERLKARTQRDFKKYGA